MKVMISVRIDENLKNKIKMEGKKNYRSLSNEIIKTLKDKYEKKSK